MKEFSFSITFMCLQGDNLYKFREEKNEHYSMGGYEVTADNEQPMMLRVCSSAVKTGQWEQPKKSLVGVFDVTCISILTAKKLIIRIEKRIVVELRRQLVSSVRMKVLSPEIEAMLGSWICEASPRRFYKPSIISVNCSQNTPKDLICKHSLFSLKSPNVMVEMF
ncbi:unnamed protein product [Larinioides sclopetarius]|uniref:Uncharacterized protein n=1 Tax=Larinioides sclopetarius TaxID=280406 RepID=A0AAV2B5X7_9ARAC